MNTIRIINFKYFVEILISIILISFQSLSAKETDNRFRSTSINTVALNQIKAETIQRTFNLQSQLTDAQKKISYELLMLTDGQFLPPGTNYEHVINQFTGEKEFQFSGTDATVRDQLDESLVYIYIYFNAHSNMNEINSLTENITDTDENNNTVVAWVKVKNLEKIAQYGQVRCLRQVVPPVARTGSATTEGDGIHHTSSVRINFAQTGSGIKVGIISDGVDTRSTAQASGDLPADGSGLTVLSNVVGGDEGTAMLEIVHDMAPGASLYFHDCGVNTTAFNSAIDDLITAGCNVICDDIGWLTEPFYEDGSVASHVASVLSGNDIIYISSAGNAGLKHHQSDFYPLSGNPTYHDFSAGTEPSLTDMYCNLPLNGNIRVVLQWNDQFGSSGNDYNLYLYSFRTSAIVASSVNVQNGNDDPLEFISYTANGTTFGDFAILVVKSEGAASKNLEVYMYGSNGGSTYMNNTSPVDAIFGHPAVPGALGVGAIAASDPDNDDIELFSSQGPVTISYPSSESRAKPDICGIDGVDVTGAGGFSDPFYGTSAAAPHIAAIAAQLWSALPSSTGDEIRDMITDDAVDMGSGGFDNVFGYGRADALAAYEANNTVVRAKLKVYLEGCYDQTPDTLRTDLNTLTYLPTTSPYSADPRSITAVPSWNIVDWVLVQLRSTATGATVASKSALLRNDGYVVGDDAVQDYIYFNVAEGNYFLLVNHRDHLSIMSATTPAFTKSSSTLFDFTTTESGYYGGDACQMGTKYCMFAGETNNSGTITVSDKASIVDNLNDSGYYTGDTNFSGTVTVADKDCIINNLNVSSGVPVQE
ncbi:S8 family serine peptidase [candidate division KSB1 bacterium]|nr:S8 family serine peptidase [candidate division KSB1 bacterium]